MITAFSRTILLYLLIVVGMRLMGKRQIGELEPSELVLTMMISDLASVPMQDFGIPLLAGFIPILTLLALSIGNLLGGTAIVESIFLWDGVGKLAVDAINMRDYPMIQAYVVWMAIIYVLVNLIADLLYRALDPRIRLGEETS